MALKLCESYQNLSPQDKVIFQGSLMHAALFSEKCFELAQGLINLGHLDGVFKDVKLGHQPTNNNEIKY